VGRVPEERVLEERGPEERVLEERGPEERGPEGRGLRGVCGVLNYEILR
jgi:hypothetical protein